MLDQVLYHRLKQHLRQRACPGGVINGVFHGQPVAEAQRLNQQVGLDHIHLLTQQHDGPLLHVVPEHPNQRAHHLLHQGRVFHDGHAPHRLQRVIKEMRVDLTAQVIQLGFAVKDFQPVQILHRHHQVLVQAADLIQHPVEVGRHDLHLLEAVHMRSDRLTGNAAEIDRVHNLHHLVHRAQNIAHGPVYGEENQA